MLLIPSRTSQTSSTSSTTSTQLLPVDLSHKSRKKCQPCPLIQSSTTKPYEILQMKVQRQFTVSQREARAMEKHEREELIQVPVRGEETT